MLTQSLSYLTGKINQILKMYLFNLKKSFFPKGCKICNSSWNSNAFKEDFCGYLTGLTVKKIQNKRYVHFENTRNTNSIQTMLLYVQNASFTSEIQV
jgi:hypothetical protein